MFALFHRSLLFLLPFLLAAMTDAAQLSEIRMRDACILPDPETQTYYLVASAWRGGVRQYTSRDLKDWEGPEIIWQTPEEFWPGCEMAGVWAPELHRYRDKYYLFLTFNTRTELCEQWRNWRPRVRRGSQVLVADSPSGPFQPFARKPTLPEDMMTLDGTLWVEEGQPWMVYCHEWVQITNGTIEMVPLKEDLSAVSGDPVLLFRGNQAPWNLQQPEGCWVTDGPSFHTSKSGRLFMIWSGFGVGGYTVGVAVSDSGRLAGPWRQNAEPLYSDDGGHGFIFKRFDGQLMLTLHSPNQDAERIRLFEIEDTGETLRIVRPFGGD